MEGGLSSGTNWSATLDDKPITKYSANNTIIFTNVTNGTYNFTIGSVAGYVANPSSGTVTVNGTNAYVSVSFESSTTYLGLTEDELFALTGGIAVGLAIGVGVSVVFLNRGRTPPVVP